jgi:hypothetical protein
MISGSRFVVKTVFGFPVFSLRFMQLAFRLITTLFFFAFFTACQRPYALYHRTPGEQFRAEIKPPTARQTLSSDTLPEAIISDEQPVEEELLEASASTPNLSARPPLTTPNRPIGLPLSRGLFDSKKGEGRALSVTESPLMGRLGVRGSPVDQLGVEADQQPRPKARSNNNPPRKTFREWLGLKPRPKLNWWQRISWKIKASVFVILIAVVFAILNINTLAIIFGIIGAVLLVSGLRKTFKVRRPWF